LFSIKVLAYNRTALSFSSPSESDGFLPNLMERKHLLVPGVLAKNADTWIKYVFREAYGLSGKTLGADFQDFLAKVQGRTAKTETLKTENVK
ncbi:14884_t:CDS:2, partial [Rhizophagus irregularis]